MNQSYDRPDVAKPAHLRYIRAARRPVVWPKMLSELSAAELLARVQQKNEDALVALHTRYASAVYAVACQVLGDPLTAEEVTQDTFLRLWDKAHTFDPARGEFIAWLLTITRRLAIDVLRQRQRRLPLGAEMVSLDEHPYLYEQLPEEADESRDLRRSLVAELRRLPEEQRQAVALAYFFGLSHGDIAAHLNLPVGTVKTRIRLGMQKLRQAWLAHAHPTDVNPNGGAAA